MSFLPTRSTATRIVAPTHSVFVPDEDQEGAVRFMVGQYIVAALCDIGSGKTAITLEAFTRLRKLGMAKTLLVVAPVKVVYETWPPEIAKWTQFKDMRVAILHGPKKDARLKEDADVYLINYEGLDWLSKKFYGRSLPYDIVAFDELSKMRNSRAQRHKAMRSRLKGVRRRWGLTGTPAPNGYENLFGQMLILDEGAALGKYITHYRDSYFIPSFDGFSYMLKKGADKQIEARIKPYVVRIAAKNLPPVFDVVHKVTLPPKAKKAYEAMKKDMLAALEGATVSAVNAGALHSKLLQMANGAVYVGDVGADTRDVVHLHDAKLDALEDLVESLNGAQLLVAYAFQHDLARLLKRWPGTPFMGGGTTHTASKAAMQAWNSGRAPLMFIHPASAGHGLNMQLSGAHHIAWFGLTYDRELYDQAIGRLVRRGQSAETVYNHLLMVEGSLDTEVVAALHDKDTTQKRLLDRLHVVLHSADNHPTAGTAETTESDMAGFKKLGRQGEDDAPRGPGRDDDGEAPRNVPKGWGGKAGGDDEPPARRGRDDDRDEAPRGRGRDDDDQRERVRGKVSARDADEHEEEPPAVRARNAFKQREPEEDEPPRTAEPRSREPADERPAPAGWGKKPVEGEEQAPPPKAKRTRTAAPKEPPEDPYPGTHTQESPRVMTVDESARHHGREAELEDHRREEALKPATVKGKNGDAAVTYDPATGVADLHLHIRLSLGQLAGVLNGIQKAIEAPPF